MRKRWFSFILLILIMLVGCSTKKGYSVDIEIGTPREEVQSKFGQPYEYDEEQSMEKYKLEDTCIEVYYEVNEDGSLVVKTVSVVSDN